MMRVYHARIRLSLFIDCVCCVCVCVFANSHLLGPYSFIHLLSSVVVVLRCQNAKLLQVTTTTITFILSRSCLLRICVYDVQLGGDELTKLVITYYYYYSQVVYPNTSLNTSLSLHYGVC